MYYYKLLDLTWGQMGLVWQGKEAPRLVRIFLPDKQLPSLSLIEKAFPQAEPLSHPKVDEICNKLSQYDCGRSVHFSFPELEYGLGSKFSLRVWRETAGIPRGKVMTYGQLASKIGAPRAARAVGTALGQNPLPLIIPCHRVIRTDGRLGGFSGGGIAVKQRLLEKEGIIFDQQGRVKQTYFYG